MNGLKRTPSFECRQFETTVGVNMNAAQARALHDFITGQPSDSVPSNVWSFGERLRGCAARAEQFAERGATPRPTFTDEQPSDAPYLDREPS